MWGVTLRVEVQTEWIRSSFFSKWGEPWLLHHAMHTVICLKFNICIYSSFIEFITAQGSHKVDTKINRLNKIKSTRLDISQLPRKPPTSLAVKVLRNRQQTVASNSHQFPAGPPELKGTILGFNA
jgi:hypothetical protein